MSALTTAYQVSAVNIAVVSSTKGQALTIREKLKSAGLDVMSLTILESQGNLQTFLLITVLFSITGDHSFRHSRFPI